MSKSKGHVSNVLAEVFRRGGMKRAVKRAEAVLLWPQVVGTELSRFTEARSLKDGVLYIEVPDSETGMHLSLQRRRFLDVYKGKFGVRDVREIHFRVGRPRILPEEPVPPPPAKVDPKKLAELAGKLEHLDLPDALNKPTLKTAKALLAYRERRRKEGWCECSICEALIPEAGLCDACQRYAGEPKVKQASLSLATSPDEATPLLSNEERAVAVHLAKRYLKDKLQELLPYVLADPTYKPELEAVARCYAAHELNKQPNDISEDDLDILDHRVARALGRWK